MGGVKPAPALIACALAAGGMSVAACSSSVPAACGDSMSAAARASDPDAESALVATLSACRTVDDWVAALREHPSAGSRTSYSTSDAHDVLNLVCLLGPDTVVCTEAAERNLLDFDLDDPRLRELDD
jgi:hypothetical protein